jgi:hypothetical protein
MRSPVQLAATALLAVAGLAPGLAAPAAACDEADGASCPLMAALGERAPCTNAAATSCCGAGPAPAPSPAESAARVPPEAPAFPAPAATGAAPALALGAAPAAGRPTPLTDPVPLYTLHAALLI